MALIDECTFHAKAGDGGDGVVRWMRAKFKPKMGPGGGNGGRGGSVRVKAVADLLELVRVKRTQKYCAENGDKGGNYEHTGKSGKDVIIHIPVGSVVRREDTGETWELLMEGEECTLLKGGLGGMGNAHFKSSTNVAPKESTDGGIGEEADFFVELRLIADAGLVGLPNAGKSSLLNTLTKSSAKVGAYQFTTLEPNLGALRGFILADIPGLIEGASEGRGLGHKFLKHIARTKMLLHLVSLENDDPLKAYRAVRAELEAYDTALGKKPEIIVLTKTDNVDKKIVTKTMKKFATLGVPVHAITILDDTVIKEFTNALIKTLQGI